MLKQYNFPGSSNFVKKPVRFPDQLPGYKELLGADGARDIISSDKDLDDREGGDIQYNQIIPSDPVTKQSSPVSLINFVPDLTKI